MDLPLPTMHWLDWIGLALVAYGLASGWMRGFPRQCTRLGVLFVALGLASLSARPSAWLAAQFDFRPDDSPAAVPLLQLALFGLAFLALSIARGLVFLWVEGPSKMPSRVGGALGGLLSAFVAQTILMSAISWTAGPDSIARASSYPVVQRIVVGLGKVPSPPRPLFLSADRFPPRPGAPARDTASGED